jgi:hypothetical protein
MVIQYADQDGVLSAPIEFSASPQNKISKQKNGESLGEDILAPMNGFFELLGDEDQRVLYQMYAESAKIISEIETIDHVKPMCARLTDIMLNAVVDTNLVTKLVEFTGSPRFRYPDLSGTGVDPWHTRDKTYSLPHYIEVTALSIYSKIISPIWSKLLIQLQSVGVSSLHREMECLAIIDPVLTMTEFTPIYAKLTNTLTGQVANILRDKDKAQASQQTSDFILTHSHINRDIFNRIIMATIIVKRLVSYNCDRKNDSDEESNAMSFIYYSIAMTVDNRLKSMKNELPAQPRRELRDNNEEDNSSIVDHISRTSRRPVDEAIFVIETFPIPRQILLDRHNIDYKKVRAAVEFYRRNHFDIPLITEAMVVSFAGKELGGTKCLQYLRSDQYLELVAMMQIYLLRNGFKDLAMLASSITMPSDGDHISPLLRAHILATTTHSAEYVECTHLFRGHVDKHVTQYGGKKSKNRKYERVDFAVQISNMTKWILEYSHLENVAPSVWDAAGIVDYPIRGMECVYDRELLVNLCRYYLQFHSPS